MKVAIVLHQFLPRYTTGTELYVYELARAFCDLGLEVALFTGEDDGHSFLRGHEYRYDGLRIHRFTHHHSLEAEPVQGEYASPLAEAAFGRFLDQVKPDVVHIFHLYGLGGGLMDSALVRGIPYLVHLMDFWFLCPRIQMLDFEGNLCSGPETAKRCARCAGEVDGNLGHLTWALDSGGALKPIQEKVDQTDSVARALARDLEHVQNRWPYLRERLKRAAWVVSPSLYMREKFLENGLEAEDIRVLKYGINPKRLPAASRKPTNIEYRFGYMGNLATFKGAHIALKAFSRLEGEHLRLLVFGDFFFREKDQMKECRTLMKRDSRIKMCGPFHHRDLGKVLRSIDSLVVPSLWHENTPFVILEALQSNTPVIGSRVGGIKEIVREGKDGLLFERGNVEDLCLQMRAMANDRVVSQVKPLPVPSLQSNAEDIVQLYREAVAENTPPESDEVKDIEERLKRRLFRTIEALGETFAGLGMRTRKHRDVITAVRKVGRLREELVGHQQSLQEHVALNRRLQSDLAKIEHLYHEEREGRGRQIRDLEKDLEGHRRVISEKNKDLDGHRRALDEIRLENKAHRKVEEALKQDLERHREALFARENEISEYKKIMVEMERDIKGHRITLDVVKKDLEGHRVALHESRREALEARELEKRVRSLEEQLQGTDQELSRIRDLHEAARDTIRKQGGMMRGLEIRLKGFLEEIDSSAQGPNL